MRNKDPPERETNPHRKAGVIRALQTQLPIVAYKGDEMAWSGKVWDRVC